MFDVSHSIIDLIGPFMGVKAFAARLDFARRHLPLALPYLTLRKLGNLALNEAELRLGRNRLRSLPPFIKLESSPLCHLSCTGCLHSNISFKKSLGNNKHLSLETVKAAVAGLEGSLIGASLSYTGEPLLNRELIPIISYLNSSGYYTSFPTNLSLPLTEKKARDLVTSGLDLLMVSLDGTSAESYAKFRKGGNFELVKKNVELLSSIKKMLGQKRPYLLWKFIIFDHNRHEVSEAKKYRKALGFDGIEFDLDHDSADYLDNSRFDADEVKKVKPCYWIWNTATVTWNGDVQPCCKQMNKLSVGTATEGLKSIWNGRDYQALRQSFTDGRLDALNDVCRTCIGLAPSRAPH